MTTARATSWIDATDRKLLNLLQSKCPLVERPFDVLADQLEIGPDEVIVRRWERAIPQYVIGHPTVMKAVDALEEAQPGLHVGGNFRGGISVGDCVSRACESAQKIAASLAGA